MPALAHVAALAQDGDAIIPNQPEDGGSLLVFVVVGLVLGSVYWIVRRSRRRSEQAYWDRRDREEELRRNDPDMAKPADPVDPEPGSDEG